MLAEDLDEGLGEQSGVHTLNVHFTNEGRQRVRNILFRHCTVHPFMCSILLSISYKFTNAVK